MAVNINNLYKRFTALETETKINQRRYQEEAEKAVKALAQISDEAVQQLSREFPALLTVKSYTVEMLLENKHGERELLQRLYNDMTFALDKRLKHFEDSLC